MTLLRFRPKLLGVLSGYSAKLFSADLAAGLTVGIVALPLAMAFAIASGAPPQAGLVTAVIAGGIISALGGTNLCIGGPTGAFVVILYGILAKYGWNDLMVCTMMAASSCSRWAPRAWAASSSTSRTRSRWASRRASRC
jgi:SulP family sulfate permease